MRHGRYIVAIGLISLSACSSNTVKDTLGLNRSAPDEFRVISRPPLSIPPDFSLRPPDNSDVPMGKESASQQAQSIVVDGKTIDNSAQADTAVTPVKVKNTPAPKAKADKYSAADEQFLKDAGADKANPKVRDILAEDQYNNQLKQEDHAWWDVFSSNDEKKDPLVDASKESDRIKADQDAGQPITTGETQDVKKRDTGLIGEIFGY